MQSPECCKSDIEDATQKELKAWAKASWRYLRNVYDATQKELKVTGWRLGVRVALCDATQKELKVNEVPEEFLKPLQVFRCNSERIEREYVLDQEHYEEIILKMQLRKNWKCLVHVLRTKINFASGCNSERIESLLTSRVKQYRKKIHDATQKELKERWYWEVANIVRLLMQLRKNWKLAVTLEQPSRVLF